MDPFTLFAIAAALQAGSTISNNRAAAKAQKGINAAQERMDASRERNQKQAAQALKRTEDTYKALPEDEGRLAGEIANQYKAMQAPIPDGSGGSLIAPAARSQRVVSEEKSQRTQDRAEANGIAEALAALTAGGEAFTNAGVQANRNRQDIARYGDFTSGYANNVMPLDMKRGQMKGMELAGLADLLQMGSQMALMAGLGKPSAGTTKAPMISVTPEASAQMSGLSAPSSIAQYFGGNPGLQKAYAARRGAGAGRLVGGG